MPGGCPRASSTRTLPGSILRIFQDEFGKVFPRPGAEEELLDLLPLYFFLFGRQLYLCFAVARGNKEMTDAHPFRLGQPGEIGFLEIFDLLFDPG